MAAAVAAAACALFDLFEIPRFPTAVKGGRLWTIDAEIYKPAFAWAGFDPLACVSGGRLRAEIEIHRFVRRLAFQLEHRAQGLRALIRASVPGHVQGALQARILCMSQQYYGTSGQYRWDFRPRAESVE